MSTPLEAVAVGTPGWFRTAGVLAVVVRLLLVPVLVAAQSDAVRLHTVSIVDQQGVGFEAYRMVVPVDWQVDGAVVWWIPVNCSYPAALHIRAFNPRRAEEVNVFPARLFVWAPRGMAFFPPGRFYLGNEVHPLVDASQYVYQYTIPRFRPDLAQARHTGTQPLPDLAHAVEAIFPGLAPQSSAVRVSFEYEQQGQPIQEDVYVAIVALQLTPPLVHWGPYALFSFKAERGQLADSMPFFGTIIASLRPTPRWYNRYLQVSDACARSAIEASNQAVLRRKIIAQTNDQISAPRRQAFEKQQAAQDRINATFSHYLGGVESYQNPFEGRRVELPSGYSHVWANRLGEYILSNGADYNPNVDSHIQWQEMQK
jgi:hypothetical protein